MFLNKNQQFQSFATGMGSGQKYCCQNSVMGQVPSTFWTSTGTGTAGTCTTAETDVMFYSGSESHPQRAAVLVLRVCALPFANLPAL